MNPLSSWLGALNFLVLQWMFVRLEETVARGTGEHLGWSVIGPIVPVTGWWNRYWWLAPRSWRRG